MVAWRIDRSVHARARLKRGGIAAEPADGQLPHLIRRDVEDQRRIDGDREPRRLSQLTLELSGSPHRVPDDDAGTTGWRLLQHLERERLRRGEHHTGADLLLLLVHAGRIRAEDPRPLW